MSSAPDAALATQLLREQAPHLAQLAVRPSPASGSSNWVFRVGGHLALRLPRSDDYATDLGDEITWLPTLGAGVRTPIPRVEFVGTPSETFPRHWAVVTWIEGRTPTNLDASAQRSLASSLGEFVAELHAVDTDGEVGGAERWGYRCGDPVTDATDAWVDQAAATLSDLFDPTQVRLAWARLREVEAATGSRTWVHTDLSTENVLVRDGGTLAGVIDFGGLGVGDPAVDLLYAWDLFDAPARAVFARAAAADEATTARARAWAFPGPGLVTLAEYRDSMPERTVRLTRMVEAVAADVGVRLR
ncbi:MULTISPECIES: phosphotransferase [unclassified Dermacoccus]|uniref:phosphotransferase n=1 Tax=unclassified Dermacoccus TaxID=2643059 RepID=UPI001CEC9AF1|nr:MULTISPECIES: phosphotransferase [unclassified Dermacoccus]MBZ4497340.1 phosphotransferase [Dermacoccus sp. Tok2021]